ncbi:hypothetical protein [Nitratireductor aquimarinus]|nr:hypothetical protein [Nitratireductor aquimarinus]
MSDVAYAQSLFREAFPKSRYGKVDALLYEAYRFLKPRVENRIERPFTIRRCETLHRGTARRVDGAELDALKEARIEEMKRERKEIIERLAALEGRLARNGPLSASETLSEGRDQAA